MFFTRTVSLTAAIVVFITTYALVLPAITLEKTASCGIEEHQHDDSCYEEILICGREESDGHQHDDSCYTVTRELKCGLEEHQHSAEDGCYDEEGNLICQISEHSHDDSCYSEVKTLTCGLQESEGHHHTDACYEKVLVCGKEVHTHSEKCYTEDGGADDLNGNTGNGSSSEVLPQEPAPGSDDAVTESIAATAEAAAEEVLPEGFVPELEPINMEAVLGKKTGFYYFHAEEGQEVPSNSAEITDWQKVRDDTELASTDLVRMYLPYSIPAGSLNETNPTARYRLPGNIHLTDDQIRAISKNENGITAGFAESDPQYQMYLGAEAIEGDRTPDERPGGGAQEYISAVVRAENVYRGDQYIGQDLIFTFVPYTIEKNQKTYDAEQNPLSAGEKVTGWFACDFRLDQIDWIEEEKQEETQEEVQEDTQEIIQDESEETDQGADYKPDNEAESVSADENSSNITVITIEKTADILFVSEDKDEDIQEIRCTLKQIEKKEITVSEEEKEEEKEEYQSGTLTAEGDGYKITLDYSEEAKIPENASLSVREITAETDKEAYEACLAQAQQHVDESVEVKSTVDSRSSRFFDIEIQVENEDGTRQKIEPAAPVSVNIQIADLSPDSSGSESGSKGEQNSDPTVLHFAEEGVEQIEATASAGETDVENGASESDAASGKDTNTDSSKESKGESEGGETTEIRFEAESFSIYGVVYTVDFHWEVDGKTYDFSIPGGGFVSFEHLAEVLNLAASETDDETAGSLADTANGPEEAASIADEAIRLNEVAVSDRTKQFTACVQNIEFSNPLLADVCKVDTDTTVGQIKADRALEVEYSADLTKEQIDAINAQVIEGGDWVLISEHPFDTEETLTVTMKTGEVFVIKVTDSNFASTVDGKTFALIIANNAKTSGYALDVNVRGDGRFTSRQTNINYLGETVNEEVYFCDNVNSIKWTFEYIKGSGNQFKLKANNGQYLHYENGRFSLSNEPTILYADVTPGDNDHVRLCLDEGLHNAINLYGGNNGFGIWGNGSNDSNEKFTLCKPFDMSTNTPGTITTVDNNAEGIELKLFDYDYIATPGTTGDLDKEGNRIYGDTLGSSYNTSVNTGKKFWFLGWGSDSNQTAPGINDFTGLGDNIRALQGIVKNNLVGGYPELAVDQNGNATNDSLAYLFDGTANDTKSYTANHLFEKIGDKYSYDSNKHYAEFNKTTGNFTVYDGTLEQNSGADKQYAKNDKAVGFFPFDSYSDMKGLYDNNRLYLNPNISENDQRKSNGQHYRMNHHNGMSLDAHFRMPEAGKDSYGNDIEFEFSGDDDLWVYIDDVLVLDIGGVHQPLNGKINFTTGEVTVDAAVETDGVSSSAIAGASTTIEEMFRKAGKTYDPHKLHEMKVFWIERGGCDSNCKIEFNLPLTTTKEAGAVTFDKVSALNQSLKLEGAVFTLYTDPACTTPLLIGNVPVTATSGEDGVVNFYAIPTGDYYVKETTFPEGYAAKDPEEIFTVHVAKDTTSRPLINGAEVNPVTNEPKKISVDVEKVWENGIIPDGAAIEIVLGRYRLVEDPNAQGKGTLVIRDSYTGLPTGSNYNVTYTITGPDNYSNTIRKSYADTSKDIEISVPNLPAGVQYTVTKTVAGISHYNTNNGSGTQTAIVPKKGSVDVRFSQSTFTRNAYKVTIYSLDKKVNVNTWVAAKYYPANSSLYLRGSYKNDSWARGRRFQYSFDNSTFKDFQIEQNGQWNQTGRTEQFTLNQDIDIYIRTKESDNDANSWTKDYDWFVNPTINGANPVSTNSAGRMMMASPARAAANVLSQTAPAPTLPVPPKDTVYELDAEYAADPGKITLSGNTWTGSIGDLYADNEYGPYVYYIAQVNETGMPEGTQITISNEVTMDGAAQVLTVTNTVPTGYLRIDKSVTFNGISPVPDDKKAALAGTYEFKVYTDENCSIPYKVKNGETESDLTLTVTIGNDGAAQSSGTVQLPVGDYWIEEQTPSQTGVTPDANRIHVVVTESSTASSPATAEFVNNKDESNDPDEQAIELEKKFSGITDASQIPSDFHVTLSYKVPGSDTPVTITLNSSTEGHVTCTKSNNDLTWHWRITHIPVNATDFSVNESNYDIGGYTRVTKINGTTVEDPSSPEGIVVLQPEISMVNFWSDYTTSDKRKIFPVTGNQILLVRSTTGVTVVVSQKSLSMATRNAIEDLITNNGGKIPGDPDANATWETTFVYFSHEIQGDRFSYGGRTIFFNGNNVEVPHNASSHEVRVDINYISETVQNSFVLENNYTEIPITIDIEKVEKDDTSVKLPGAVFTLRKIKDADPINGTYATEDGTSPRDSEPTAATTGMTSFDNLTNGYYELTEKTAPAGYVLTDEMATYFKVESGVVTWLVKGDGKPSTWTTKSGKGSGELVDFEAAVAEDTEQGTAAKNAKFVIENEPGAALPNTGGPGTRLFTILGSILILGAGVLLWRRRRLI